MAASTVSASVTPYFYLFKSPLVIAPSFELWRSISGHISTLYYRQFHESNFTEEGLLHGAKVGIYSCADAICRDDRVRLNYLLTSPAMKYVRNRVEQLPPDLINSRLAFNQDNIVSIFTHSKVMSTDRILALGKKAKPTFYATIVAFIDQNSTTPISAKEAQQRAEELLICNITFGRVLNPLGRWQISDLNFFDGKAVRYL